MKCGRICISAVSAGGHMHSEGWIALILFLLVVVVIPCCVAFFLEELILEEIGNDEKNEYQGGSFETNQE